MLSRGRSRQVSHAAIARRASEERRVDYYDSPPSPPRTLEDQVHVAYAHDNFHLAKVLLLRLKGIHVTGPDDPRIAEVKDEDFDFCFVPHRLMDDDEEKALQEKQQKEMERLEEMKRLQRLRDCEKIWEQGKKRLRELRTLAVRKRELEQRMTPPEESRPRRISRPPRTVVSYRLVSPSSTPQDEPFVYDFMPTPVSRPASASHSQKPSHSKSKSPFTRPLFDDSRTVPFSDVLSSMQGPLFPQERTIGSQALDVLLAVVEDEQRSRKGKGPERPVPRRKDSGGPCATCSSSSSSSSSRRSWLSFSGASSSSSISTAATTPSSSPPSSSTLLSKQHPRPKSWFLTKPKPLTIPAARPCRCCTTLHFIPVSPADAPLRVTSPTFSPPRVLAPITTIPEHPAPDPSFLRHIMTLVDLARGFQHAYMTAAMFAVPDVTRTPVVLPPPSAFSPSITTTTRKEKLHPPGLRARSADVRAFLVDSSSPQDPFACALRPIPLLTLSSSDPEFNSDEQLPTTRRTTLPSPLPYKLHFKPQVVAPRSPWRAVCGPGSSMSMGAEGQAGEVVFRVRNVENPIWVRVKALEGASRERGLGVEEWVGGGAGGGVYFGSGSGWGFGVGVWGGGMRGRGVPREGMLGCGREKVLRVVKEGRGGSRLRWEMEVEVPESNPSSVEEEDVYGVRTRGRGRGRVMRRCYYGDERQLEEKVGMGAVRMGGRGTVVW